MAHRAPKSGIALEAQQKVASKWDKDEAIRAFEWLGQCIGERITTDGSMDNVHEQLEDGILLCKLANWVKPGAIPAAKLAKKPTLPFKKMELIGLFLETIDSSKGGCVKATDLFQTVDLYEKVNLVQVIQCFAALGRAMLSMGRAGYGKAESKGQHHEWSDEQLNAGKGIIGLQMGSNKGATQAGQNFGKSRDIMS